MRNYASNFEFYRYGDIAITLVINSTRELKRGFFRAVLLPPILRPVIDDPALRRYGSEAELRECRPHAVRHLLFPLLATSSSNDSLPVQRLRPSSNSQRESECESQGTSGFRCMGGPHRPYRPHERTRGYRSSRPPILSTTADTTSRVAPPIRMMLARHPTSEPVPVPAARRRR